MVLINSTLMALAMSMVANGIAIPSAEDLGLSKRGNSGVFLLDFSINQRPAGSKRNNRRGTPETALNNVEAELYYSVDIVFGSQKETVQLDLDTGSSDTWVAAKVAQCNGDSCLGSGSFDQTKSSTWKDLKKAFHMEYADESGAQGTWGTDSVGFVNGPILSNLQFGLATTDTAGAGTLALGKQSDELMPSREGMAYYPTFLQVMKDQGYINKLAYSLYLNAPSAQSGSLVLGGYDTEKFSGSLVKLPIESNLQVTVTLDSITTAGGNTANLDTSALLDSGTSLIYLPQEVINSVATELEGSDGEGNYLCDQGSKTLNFNFKGVSIAVPYSSLLSSSYEDYCLLNIQDGGNSVNLGDPFLRSAYVLYDFDDNEISLAQVKYSDSTNLVSL